MRQPRGFWAHGARSLAAGLAAGIVATACSMGTEVGNGFKPRDKSKPTPDAGRKTTSNPEADKGAPSPAQGATVGLPSPLRHFAAPCASPFTEALANPLSIAPKDGGTPLRAELIDDLWHLSQGEAQAKMSLGQSGGRAGISCDGPSVTDEADGQGPLRHHRVAYRLDGQAFVNEWWVRPAAGPGELPRLVRVRVTTAQGQDVVTETPGS